MVRQCEMPLPSSPPNIPARRFYAEAPEKKLTTQQSLEAFLQKEYKEEGVEVLFPFAVPFASVPRLLYFLSPHLEHY